MEHVISAFATFINWLNNNSGFVMAILTAVYVVATIWIVRESRNTNRIQSRAIEQSAKFESVRNRPYVVFSLNTHTRTISEHDMWIDLYAIIKNVGPTPAHNVTVRTVPELNVRQGWDPDGVKIYATPTLLRTVVSLVPPAAETSEQVGPTKFLYEDRTDAELVFAVSVTYEDVNGTKYSESYSLDLSGWRNRYQSEDSLEKAQFRVVRLIGEIGGNLAAMSRTLAEPDRSRLLVPVDPSNLSDEQLSLLSHLDDLIVEGYPQTQFMMNTTLAGTTISAIGGPNEETRIEVSGADVEYLCRAGALSGHYHNGALFFSVSPPACRLLQAYRARQVSE